MEDIYNKVYKKIYEQCLKLLDPRSPAYELHRPMLTSLDKEVLEAFNIEDGEIQIDENGRVLKNEDSELINEDGVVLNDKRTLKDVRSGSPDLANINQRAGQQFPLPILFLEIGTGGIDFLHPSIANSMKGEVFHVKIRCVVDKPSITDAYSYEASAPVKLLKIRNHLDYLLDLSFFGGLRSERIGYDRTSLLWNIEIMATEALEGLPASYDAADRRVIAEIHKQKLRGN